MSDAPRNPGITELLDSPSARKVIEPFLHPGSDYRRVIQEVYLAVSDNPELLECEPASIVRSVSKIVSWGLVVGETAYLIPRNVKVSKPGEPNRWVKRCTALQSYTGKIELIVRSGSARAVDAENVYENDDFVLELGSTPNCRHSPTLDPEKRGALLGSYAVARLSFGNLKITWVPASEIEAIRQKLSQSWKGGTMPYWYGPKTAVHRIAKMIPKSEQLARVLAQFAEEEADEFGEAAASDTGPRTVTLGAPPEKVDAPHAHPLATSDDGYGEVTQRALTEGAAQAIPVAKSAGLEAARRAVASAGPMFDECPFPDDR